MDTTNTNLIIAGAGDMISLYRWCERYNIDPIAAKTLAERKGVPIYTSGGHMFVGAEQIAAAILTDVRDQAGKASKRKLKDLNRRKTERALKLIGLQFLACLPEETPGDITIDGLRVLARLGPLIKKAKEQFGESASINYVNLRDPAKLIENLELGEVETSAED